MAELEQGLYSSLKVLDDRLSDFIEKVVKPSTSKVNGPSGQQEPAPTGGDAASLKALVQRIHGRMDLLQQHGEIWLQSIS
jgi:hypothetical protein